MLKKIKNTIKYDNCKNCKSKCEHAGKDREFICTNGISCKVTYTKEEIEEYSSMFISAVKTMAEKPDNLENFKSYLDSHFSEWLQKYANTPEGIATEMKNFATIEF